MEILKTYDDYLCHCNFNAELADELSKRYPPSPSPWLFEDAVEYSAEKQHFTVNFRNFDGSRHLAVGVKRVNGAFQYTFSEK